MRLRRMQPNPMNPDEGLAFAYRTKTYAMIARTQHSAAGTPNPEASR